MKPSELIVAFGLTAVIFVVHSVCLSIDENHGHVDNNGQKFAILGGPWHSFISYRRSFSRHLAMLLKVLMIRENMPAFLDVEDLGPGHWDEQILEAIAETPNFIMVLSNGTLDRCIGDTNYTDFLHKEIREAVTTNRNIIPIFDEFTRPDADFSPEINEMLMNQGVEWNHSLVNATLDRIIGYFINTTKTVA